MNQCGHPPRLKAILLLLGSLFLFIPQIVAADITGKVFLDFNANGTFDTGASFNEVGMAGITVKAFDAAGTQATTATTTADGSYTLTGLRGQIPAGILLD